MTRIKDVFIVHGHNHAKKIELKLFLTGFGLHTIVLDEEDDRGLTIIEKFEYYASTCTFVFVLAWVSGQPGLPGQSSSSASKAGIMVATKALTTEAWWPLVHCNGYAAYHARKSPSANAPLDSHGPLR